MNSNILKLNADKTEAVVFSSQHNSIYTENIELKIGDSNIKPSKSARNLGVILDSKMDMNEQVNSVSRSCYAQLRRIGHIRPYLSSNATKTLVNSLVTSRLDYCNALLYGIPKSTSDRLQRVQNTAARLITRTPRTEHITPILRELHWLPITDRIKYKIIIHTFKALHDKSPRYISDLVQIYHPNRNLRSKDQAVKLVVPKSKTTTFGDRSFRIASPKLWNELPSSLREMSSLESFKKALKTHFFKLTYN